MKLSELKPNVEYLREQGRFNKEKIKLTPEAIAKGASKHYGETNNIRALVWERTWGSDHAWVEKMIPLRQIKSTWEEWEAERERRTKAWEIEQERIRIENQKQQAEAEELQAFLLENKPALIEILGTDYLWTHRNRLEVKLSLETLKRMIERMN